MICPVRKWIQLVGWVAGLAALMAGSSAWAASVVPMSLNGLVVNHEQGQSGFGGFQQFTYNGSDLTQAPSVGRFNGFVFDSLNATGGDLMTGSGTGMNNLANNQSPFDQLSGAPVLDVTANDFPILDRAGFGTNFDPDQYKIEVVYKPLDTNEAPVMNILMDTYDGFKIEDREGFPGQGTGKRFAEQQQWGFGYPDILGNGTTTDPETGEERGLTLNEFYDQNPKDEDGFVTIDAPLTDGSGSVSEWWRFQGPSFLFSSGSVTFQGLNTIPGDGDPDFGDFEDLTPNGAVQLHLQSVFTSDPDLAGRLHLEVKRISIVPINPDPTIVAQLDAESGYSQRFGTPFNTSTAPDGVTPIAEPIEHEGDILVINETDQLQRFDENGFTNLIINTDDDDTLGGFGVWQDPQVQTFDGTQATLEVRARLTAPLDAEHADQIGVTLDDLDGNDTGPGDGGEEYFYIIDLNQFNEDTFATVSIPLTDFDQRNQAFELLNSGDESLEDFNLFEIGVLTFQDAGLVDLELEHIRVTLPAVGLAGDFNDDGVVDAADYTVWRDNLGVADESSLNGNGDGINGVDQADFQLWKDNFGNTAGSGSLAAQSGAVPEPAAGLLAMVACGLLVALRRQTSSRR